MLACTAPQNHRFQTDIGRSNQSCLQQKSFHHARQCHWHSLWQAPILQAEELSKFKDASIYSARSSWSTCNNSVMELFAQITSDEVLYSNYINEKQEYIELLKERNIKITYNILRKT